MRALTLDDSRTVKTLQIAWESSESPTAPLTLLDTAGFLRSFARSCVRISSSAEHTHFETPVSDGLMRFKFSHLGDRLFLEILQFVGDETRRDDGGGKPIFRGLFQPSELIRLALSLFSDSLDRSEVLGAHAQLKAAASRVSQYRHGDHSTNNVAYRKRASFGAEPQS